MRTATILGCIGFVTMAAALTYGFFVGDFWGEGRVLTHLPWGQISLLDVYTGFALFSGWVIYRERRWTTSAVWVLLFLLLGNVMTCLYLLTAIRQSRGDWTKFWNGYSS